MNKQCDIVKDLLPLYADDICSAASRELIENHLSGCPECAALLGSLKNTEIEQELEIEKTEVIEKQGKMLRRKSAVAGMIIAAIFMIPVLICLIVNLASGKGLDWFFVVLAALLLAAALIVAPLLAARNKFLWLVGLGTAALIQLLGVVSIYTRDGSWFLISASAILFGLSVILGPFIVRHKAVRKYLGSQKALVVMAADTVLFFLMMIMIGFQARSPYFWTAGMTIAAIMVAIVWIFFVILRYPRCHILVRLGICFILFGAFLFSINNILAIIGGYSLPWPAFQPYVWNAFTIDMNVRWISLIIMALAGMILILIGLVKGARKK